MRIRLFAIAAVLLAASPLAAYDPPVIDGELAPGEWDAFYLDEYASDWDHGDSSVHILANVYFAQDNDYYYLAYEAAQYDWLDWTQSCTKGTEPIFWLDACDPGAVSPDDARCQDVKDPCVQANTRLRIDMTGDEPTVQSNTGTCGSYGPEYTTPQFLRESTIKFGYHGVYDECRIGGRHFRAEFAIPKSYLSSSKRVEVGVRNLWHQPMPTTPNRNWWAFTEEQLDPSGESYLCTCATGTLFYIPVSVDIKPRNDSNCINFGAESTVKVAILTTDDFNAADGKTGVLCQTIRFLGVYAGRCRTEDVNSDGRKDLVAYYKGRTLLRNGDHDCDATQTEITGETYDGVPVSGWDKICYLGNEPCP